MKGGRPLCWDKKEERDGGKGWSQICGRGTEKKMMTSTRAEARDRKQKSRRVRTENQREDNLKT